MEYVTHGLYKKEKEGGKKEVSVLGMFRLAVGYTPDASTLFYATGQLYTIASCKSETTSGNWLEIR